jgi:hypothetical protein
VNEFVDMPRLRGTCTWTAPGPIEACRDTTDDDCGEFFTPKASCTRLGYVCEPHDVGFPPPTAMWRRASDGGCPGKSSTP